MSIPPEQVIADERRWFWETIHNLICAKYGGSVISGWRSHARNKLVGGKDTSLHLIGLAADVRFNTMRSKKQVMEYGAHQAGLHWWDSHPGGRSTALHLQARPALARTERT